jgi:hypothetical protein
MQPFGLQVFCQCFSSAILRIFSTLAFGRVFWLCAGVEWQFVAACPSTFYKQCRSRNFLTISANQWRRNEHRHTLAPAALGGWE